MKHKVNAVIVSMPISVPSYEAFDCAIDDKALINAICEYRKELEKEGIEVFERNKNILATEKGYFAAFYEDDINITEQEKLIKPFMGEDGRMKVILMNDKNEPELKDLAILVATQFVPNPKKYTNVLFFDGNVENCSAENLYWSDKI